MLRDREALFSPKTDDSRRGTIDDSDLASALFRYPGIAEIETVEAYLRLPSPLLRWSIKLTPVPLNVERFPSEHSLTDTDAPFTLEDSYTLDVTVDGTVYAKAGSMIAYTGTLSFTGTGSPDGGITGLIEEAATGEGTPVMAVEGDGDVFLATGKRRYNFSNSMRANRLPSTAKTS